MTLWWTLRKHDWLPCKRGNFFRDPHVGTTPTIQEESTQEKQTCHTDLVCVDFNLWYFVMSAMAK
jgi:hypothetical protein